VKGTVSAQRRNSNDTPAIFNTGGMSIGMVGYDWAADLKRWAYDANL
jgi:hypothetical protein